MPRIDHYELLGELARGGMGVVYRALDTGLRREVALKLLPVDRPLEEEELLRFRHEAQAMARVRHRNLVNVHSAGSLEGRPYLVMDLVQGESLGQRLERGERLAPRRAAEVTARLARALAAAHAQGVIHRDVKPGNVVLDPSGEPVLIDFGLARDLTRQTRLTEPGEVLGTPAYMAPELALGDHDAVGPTTDIYALGATLYHLLAGAPPFKGRNMMDTVELILRGTPQPLSAAIDPGLRGIVLRCLEKDPRRRFPDAAALAGAREAWLEGELPRAAEPSRSPRALLALPAAGALGLLGVALLIALHPEPATVTTTATPPASSPTPLPQGPARPPPPEPTAPASVPTSDQDLWEAWHARQYARLEQLARARLQAGDRDSRMYQTLARALFEQRRLPEARPELDRALELDPDNWEAWELRARLRRETGDLQGAAADLDRLVALQPTQDKLRLRCELRILVGDLAGARQDARAATERGLEAAAAARLGERLDALETALREGRELLARVRVYQLAPTEQQLLERDRLTKDLEHCADRLDDVGESRLAESLGEAILAVVPTKDDGFEVRGRARLRLGRAEEALQDGQVLMTIDVDDADGYVLAARAALHLGRREEAIRFYRRALPLVSTEKGAAISAELELLERP